MEYLHIDGTMGEGGGSILRLSAGFSVLFKRPIHVEKIRANRNPPGLRLQHLLGLQALEDLTDGTLSDSKVQTTELKFSPGVDFKDILDIEIRTAGSLALLSQTLQNASLQADYIPLLRVYFKGGGTFGMGAPDPYYLNDVTYRYFKKMGYDCEIRINKNGFYPRGGAKGSLRIHPLKNPQKELKPLNLTTLGKLSKIGGTIIVSENLRKPKVAERIHDAIVTELTQRSIHIPNNINGTEEIIQLSENMFSIKIEYERTFSPGVGLNIWAEFDNDVVLGSGTILGKRGVPSEKVAKNAINSLLHQIESGATVDEHLADQIVPLMYICEQKSSIIVPKITSHMQTNIDLLNLFKPRKFLTEKCGKGMKFEYL